MLRTSKKESLPILSKINIFFYVFTFKLVIAKILGFWYSKLPSASNGELCMIGIAAIIVHIINDIVIINIHRKIYLPGTNQIRLLLFFHLG